jgi:hypothetical protein
MIKNIVCTLYYFCFINTALNLSRFDEREIFEEKMCQRFAGKECPIPIVRRQEGRSFTRNINVFPADAAFVMSLADDDCKQHDVFGDNDCHFSWGQNVTGKFNVKFSDQIEERDYIVGDFKVRIEYVQKC